MSLTVTANAGGQSSPGILLRVLVLDSAALPATLNTASQSATGTHDASITPAYSNSWILSAEIDMPTTAAAPVAAANNTAYDAVSDAISSSSQDYGYGTFRYTGTVTAGTAVTAGSADSDAGGVAVLEIEPSGTVALDGSSPAVVSSVSVGQGVSSVTTAAFTPPTGTLLVALVTAAGSPYGQATMTVSDSYGLTWTEAVAANATGNGYAGIWVAYAPAALAVSTTSLPAGSIGYSYSASLQAGGGYSPYTWALASGSLPAGLTLDPNTGSITGVPTASGTSTFTVTATDAAGSTATSASLSITVAAAPTSGVSIYGSWVGTGPAYSYGTLAVPVSTRDHDWLFVAVSWADGEDQAIAFIADDAHNVYRPVSYNQGGIHTQIWAVPNAAAATKVYVSTSAFVRWLTVCVVDVSGLGAGYVVDGSSSTTGGPSASFGQSVNAKAADFIFAAGCFGGAPGSIGQSGSGAAWKEIYAGTNGDSNYGISQAASWGTTTGAATASMTYSPPSGSRYYAGGIVAVQQVQPATYNSNRAWPVIHVQAAFGWTPGSPATGLPTWTDITDRFWSLNGQRGRNFELDELSAADMTLELDNWDGALSPGNSNSPYGTVTLITPVQVTADWQGRRRSLFYGIIMAIPQTFDFQRGIVKVALSDDYSKLPQILLPSCMISELLYDNPICLWPLNDASNAVVASNWSGRSTSVLVPVNGKYGGGVSGNTPTTGFGNTVQGNYPSGLEGTTDTCWGNYGAAIGSAYVKGTALVDRDDAALPLTATGATYEFWAKWLNNAANVSSGAVPFVLSTEKGTNGGGDFLRMILVPTGGTPITGTKLAVAQKGLSWSGTQSWSVKNLFDGGWHHYAITITTAGVVTVYVDGAQVGSFNGTFPAGITPNRLMFGGDVTVNPYWNSGPNANSNVGAGFATGFMGYCAVFDRVIDSERIQSHFTSGETGFVGDYSGNRIQRVLQYARWAAPQAIEAGVSRMQEFNYLGFGYASNGLSGAIGQYGTAGGGFSDMGAQADITIQDVANSENGFLFVGADGTLAFRERDSLFNQAATGAIGDMDYALNKQSSFSSGLGVWTQTSSCTMTTSSVWSYAGGSSALLTVTGSPAQAYVRDSPVPAQAAGASMWVMSPGGCWAGISIDYADSSYTYLSTYGEAPAWCPPMTPVRLTIPPAAPPGGAVYMHFGPTVGQSPATGTQLYFDRPRLSPAGFQVPYNGDVEITEDIQYLFNDIAVTRYIDQAVYRVKDDTSRSKYYPRVYLRTIYTSELDPQAVVDVGNWLLSAYYEPRLRVSRVVIDAASNPEAWPFVLGTDIGDIVSFQRTPVGGATVTGDFLVISIEVDWVAGDETTAPKAEFTYVLAPSPAAGILTLDDSLYGTVGSNGLAW